MTRFLSIILMLLIISGGGYFYYSKYYKTNSQTKVEKSVVNPEIESKEVNGVFYFVDKTNKISFYIDTKKEILNENRNPNNVAKEEASVKFTVNTDSNSKIIYEVEYFPKQWAGTEGIHTISFMLVNENFDPTVYWKDYINNGFFNYDEKIIGKFKVFQTESEAGRNITYSSYFIIDSNKYIRVLYNPQDDINTQGKEQYYEIIQTFSNNTDLDTLIKITTE